MQRRGVISGGFRRVAIGAVALAVAGLALGGCGISKSDHAKVVNALDAAKAERAEEADKRRAAEEKLAALTRELAELEATGEADRRKIAKLIEEMEKLREALGMSKAELAEALDRASELEKKTKEFEALAAALKDEIAAGKIELLGNKIRMKEKILFKSGSSKLNKEGKEALSSIAAVFKKFGKTRIFQVTGHTDNVGKSSVNWKLSTDRALSVVLFLTDGGVPEGLLSAAGFGEHRPVCAANDTPECKASNRRIDIILLPNIDLSEKADTDTAGPVPKKAVDVPPPPDEPKKKKKKKRKKKDKKDKKKDD